MLVLLAVMLVVHRVTALPPEGVALMVSVSGLGKLLPPSVKVSEDAVVDSLMLRDALDDDTVSDWAGAMFVPSVA
jgi:hypothetical protein